MWCGVIGYTYLKPMATLFLGVDGVFEPAETTEAFEDMRLILWCVA